VKEGASTNYRGKVDWRTAHKRCHAHACAAITHTGRKGRSSKGLCDRPFRIFHAPCQAALKWSRRFQYRSSSAPEPVRVEGQSSIVRLARQRHGVARFYRPSARGFVSMCKADRLVLEGCDDEHKLLHRSRIQPLGKLCQDLLQILLEPRVACDQHLQTILADARKALGRVNPALH
jgi:hypothetical protein